MPCTRCRPCTIRSQPTATSTRRTQRQTSSGTCCARWGVLFLYLDADTVIRRVPELIGRLVGEGCDFAILNWLALDDNDAYMPVPCGPRVRAAWWASVVSSSSRGPSTAWRTISSSAAARSRSGVRRPLPRRCCVPGMTRSLPIRTWPTTQCLDFVFNHRLGDRSANLRPHWLPKAYARIAWWYLR